MGALDYLDAPAEVYDAALAEYEDAKADAERRYAERLDRVIRGKVGWKSRTRCLAAKAEYDTAVAAAREKFHAIR